MIKNIFSGRTFYTSGEKRYAMLVWQFAAVVLTCALLFTIYRDGRIMSDLAVQQYVVYEVDRNGQVNVRPASEYQMGPLQVEIEGRAMDAVRWIAKADSNDVDTVRNELAAIMTEEMYREFETRRGNEWAEKIKKLNIYRVIAPSEIKCRPLKQEDLPAEDRGKVKITKYDVVVYGKVDTYRRGTREWIDEFYFAYHVTLQPQEERTQMNMSALLVDGMVELEPKQVMAVTAQLEEKAAKNTQTSDETATGKNINSNSQTANKTADTGASPKSSPGANGGK